MFKRKRRSRIGAILCALCLLFSVMGSTLSAAAADEMSGAPGGRAGGGEVSERTQIAITEFEMQSESGTPQTTLKQSTWYKMKLTWDASAYEDTLQEGDYFLVTLPDEMRYPTTHSATHFDIFSPEGDVVAKAVVNSNGDSGGGTVTVTFTDYVVGRYHVKGTMYLNAVVVTEKVKLNDSNEISITVGASTATIPVNVEAATATPLHPEETLSKWYSRSSSTDEYVQWTARINVAKRTLRNAVLTDTLTANSGESGTYRYIPDRFILCERVFDEYGNVLSTPQRWDSDQLGDRLQFNEDYTSFTLDMGDIEGQQYHLIYYTTYSPGVTQQNRLRLTAGEDRWVATSSYTSASSGGTGSGDQQERVSLPVRKEWIGPAAEEALVYLYANYQKTDTSLVLNRQNNWSGVFSNLPKYAADGTAIVYGVDEEPIPWYAARIAEENSGFVITNTYLRTRDISVEKQWIGPMAESATILLLADGAVVSEAELSGATDWRCTFTGLPEADPIDGHIIAYWVAEAPPAGYTPEVRDLGEDSFVIVNTNSETLDIPVRKSWVGPALSQATVQLLADDAAIQEAALSADTDWQYTFSDLPKYDPTDGHAIRYRVEEPSVTGYTSAVSGTAETGFTVTNTIAGKLSIPVTKVWLGPAAERVTVELLANGQPVQSVTLSDENNWQYVFADVEQYQDGQAIRYTVREADVEGYTSTVTGSMTEGYTITNRSLETRDIPVSKQWVGTSLPSVTVRLLADGTETASATLRRADDWRYTFTDLLKYDRTDGHEIVYTVTEDAVEGYTAAVSGSAAEGFVITNTRRPGGGGGGSEDDTISITVRKTWVGPALESVTVRLYADGEEVGRCVLRESSNWRHIFTGMPEYDHGRLIQYTVREEATEGYTSAVNGSASGGFVITNTRGDTPTDPTDPTTPTTPTDPTTPEPPTDPGTTTPGGSQTPASPAAPSQGGTGGSSASPRTFDAHQPLRDLLIALCSGGVLVWLLLRSRRRSGQDG